jgi:flagellar biosynthesis protein FlhA
MSIGEAADVFVKLSVGDGLVTQIPALIVSLAAGLLVSRGGTPAPPIRPSSISSAVIRAR